MPSLIASLGLNISGFSRGLTEARGHAAKEGKAIAREIGTGISEKLREFAGAAAVEEALRRTIEYAEKIGNAAKRTTVAVEALQAWDQALQLNGSNIEEAIPVFEKLAVAKEKVLAGAPDSAKLLASFQKFGIGLMELKKFRVEDLALQISKVFQTGDPQELIADFRELGGRGAGAMVAAMRDGLSEMVTANREALGVMNRDTIESLKESGDEFKKMWFEIRAGMGTAFAPLLKGLMTVIGVLRDTWFGIFAVMGGLSSSAGEGRWANARKAAQDYESDLLQRDLREMQERNAKANREQKPFSEDEDGLKSHQEKKDKALKDATERMTTTSARHDLNALQQVGAYGGSAAATLDVSVKQEQHLGNIWRTIQKWDSQQPPPNQGVTF